VDGLALLLALRLALDDDLEQVGVGVVRLLEEGVDPVEPGGDDQVPRRAHGEVRCEGVGHLLVEELPVLLIVTPQATRSPGPA
jgi:hypothetical protein